MTVPTQTVGDSDPWAGARKLRDALAEDVPGLRLDYVVDALFRLDLTVVPKSSPAAAAGSGWQPPTVTAASLVEAAAAHVEDHEWVAAAALLYLPALAEALRHDERLITYRTVVAAMETLDGAGRVEDVLGLIPVCARTRAELLDFVHGPTAAPSAAGQEK